MGGNKTLVSSSDDEDDFGRLPSKNEESGRVPNGRSAVASEDLCRKRGAPPRNDDKKETQKRKLNTAASKSSPHRSTAHRPPAPAASPPKPVVKKEEVETVKNEEGTVTKCEKKESKVKVKVEYDLPGQTRPTPAENDPKKKFYASLLEERPDSEMARRWCVMHGLLSQDEAEDYLAAQRKQKQQETPMRGRAAAKKLSSKTSLRARDSTPSTD